MKVQKKIDLFNAECPSFLMVMPTNASSDNQNNVWITELSEEDRVIDNETAFNQWLDLYMFLNQQGLVTIMPSPKDEEGLADHVYAANSGMMIGDTFVVSNFTSEPRIPETAIIEKFMQNMGCKVVICPFKFEGEADGGKFIGKLDGKDTYLCGYGLRSDIRAYEWMSEQFDVNFIPVKMTNEKCYHFDCLCFPITASNNLEEEKANVFLCTEILSESDVQKVRKYCNIINVPEKLADFGLTNCVRVGSYVLCASDFYSLDPEVDGEVYYTERDKNQFLEDALSEFGMEPVFFDLSEFSKAGAMLSCNICHLNSFSYKIELV